MFSIFIMTAMLIGFIGSENEACKRDGLTPSECVERTIENSEPVDYSKMNG